MRKVTITFSLASLLCLAALADEPKAEFVTTLPKANCVELGEVSLVRPQSETGQDLQRAGDKAAVLKATHLVEMTGQSGPSSEERAWKAYRCLKEGQSGTPAPSAESQPSAPDAKNYFYQVRAGYTSQSLSGGLKDQLTALVGRPPGGGAIQVFGAFYGSPDEDSNFYYGISANFSLGVEGHSTDSNAAMVTAFDPGVSMQYYFGPGQYRGLFVEGNLGLTAVSVNRAFGTSQSFAFGLGPSARTGLGYSFNRSTNERLVVFVGAVYRSAVSTQFIGWNVDLGFAF